MFKSSRTADTFFENLVNIFIHACALLPILLTVFVLAEITNNFLSHIERSYSIPSLETLVRICDALGVTPDAVLLGTATEQSVYLADEFTGKFQACTPAQKRFILDMMDALNRENLR